ncbi:MAG: alanine dehydrogenase, partial [Candidatus Neomarinimicrobiota bacterium]
MVIGVPKEIKTQENRIAMTPFGVEHLTSMGHRVLLEHKGGLGCGFFDDDYKRAGAEIIASPEEIFRHSELIVKVKEPQSQELDMILENQVIFTYFHFAANRELTERFRDTGATAIAYETVQTSNGELPLLVPMSEVAGRMAIQEGARMLEMSNGGRGVLLGGVPGVEPATVTIIGGGVVGLNAAKIAAGMGANVYILDMDVNRLRYLDDVMPRNVTTLYSDPVTLRELLPRTDLLIGAVLVVGAKAPKLVTRDMLKLMQQGSVIVDVAVD